MKDVSEIIKNYAQIAALVVAGIWAYYIFGQKEAPSLEPMADIKGNISWHDSADTNFCRGIYTVTLQNTGNSTFEITKVHMKAWMFKRISDPNKEVQFLSLEEIRKNGKMVFEKKYESNNDNNNSRQFPNFIDQYPPGFAFTESYDWVVKIANGDWICFEIEFYKDNENNPKWITSSWDQVCNIISAE